LPSLRVVQRSPHTDQLGRLRAKVALSKRQCGSCLCEVSAEVDNCRPKLAALIAARLELVFDALDGVVDEVFSIDRRTLDLAKSLVLAYARLSARDAIHIASMKQRGVTRVMSFDAGFDGMPGIVRLAG